VGRDDQPDAREGQAGRLGYAEGFVVPLKPGNAGKGRDLSSRRTQDVVRDLGIGQPINSEECSETADSVARESRGRSWLPLLRPVDKISREDILAHAYAQCRSNKGAPGVDAQDLLCTTLDGVTRWMEISDTDNEACALGYPRLH
jgi:hypothetical protein